jgi:hypothetical protein
MARLAMLACCPWSQAKQVNSSGRGMFPNRGPWMAAVCRILSDRRPDWATEWVALQLEVEGWAWQVALGWRDVRELMKAGVIERPAGDGYIRLLAASGFTEFDPERDADVLETDVWRLFEVDTRAFDMVPDPKKIDRHRWLRGGRVIVPGELHVVYDGWPRRLCELAHRGEIDRARLLDATLAALWHDFRGPMRTGLLRFLELVGPEDEEIGARQATYLELLRNPQGPVVGIALKALARLKKARQLDCRAFLEAVPAAFGISAKSQPKSALALIDRVTKDVPDHLPGAVDAVGAALNHQSADVQEKAVDLLVKWKQADAALDLGRVTEAAIFLGAQHRRRLEELAGSREAGFAAETGKAAEKDAFAAGEADERRRSVSRRLAALPQWVRTATGLDGIEEALHSDNLPPAFHPDPGQCPVLSGVEPIEPIRDVDELIDAVSHLFEIVDGPEEIERIVDGLMRLGGRTTDDFESKTKGIRHPKFGSDWVGETAPGLLIWCVPGLIELIGRWLQTDIRDPWQTGRRDDLPALAAYAQRVHTFLPRWEKGLFGPVLATPTHRGGWIDPRVFVARLRETLDAGQIPDRFDLIGALLRLAPDFRQNALESAAELASPYGPIVRYALGGDERPTQADRDRAEEWLAAGRTRQPRGFLEDLRILGLNDQEPDGVTPAVYRFQSQIDPEELKISRWVLRHGSRCVDVTPRTLAAGSLTPRPTVALAAGLLLQGQVMSFFQEWQQELMAWLWPANPDATLALACDRLMSRLNDKGSMFEPVIGLMSPLLAVDRGWSEIGLVAIWLGLLSRNDRARGIGIDALIDGIVDGRADPEALAKTLLHIASGGWIKLNRLAESLREVTRTSALAERVAARILDPLIASWESVPRDGHHILTLQLDLLSNLQQAPSDAARAKLADVRGSGKAAKLAKHLCRLEARSDAPAMRQAALEAAEGRLGRAERIARFFERPR